MAVIYLIRHGQASFLKRNYDQLSELGIQQSGIIGSALKERRTSVSYLEGGAMKRHHQTAEHCMKTFGQPLDYNENSCWNEYSFMELMSKHQPELNGFDPLERFIKSQANPMKALHQLLKSAIQDWIEDKHEFSTSWSAFKKQAYQGIQEISAKLEKGENAWIFTSGGPIAAVVLQLLELKDTQFMAIQEKIVNASITKVLVGRRGPTLSTFNEYSHLEFESSLITYR